MNAQLVANGDDGPYTSRNGITGERKVRRLSQFVRLMNERYEHGLPVDRMNAAV